MTIRKWTFKWWRGGSSDHPRTLDRRPPLGIRPSTWIKTEAKFLTMCIFLFVYCCLTWRASREMRESDATPLLLPGSADNLTASLHVTLNIFRIWNSWLKPCNVIAPQHFQCWLHTLLCIFNGKDRRGFDFQTLRSLCSSLQSSCVLAAMRVI